MKESLDRKKAADLETAHAVQELSPVGGDSQKEPQEPEKPPPVVRVEADMLLLPTLPRPARAADYPDLEHPLCDDGSWHRSWRWCVLAPDGLEYYSSPRLAEAAVAVPGEGTATAREQQCKESRAAG